MGPDVLRAYEDARAWVDSSWQMEYFISVYCMPSGVKLSPEPL